MSAIQSWVSTLDVSNRKHSAATHAVASWVFHAASASEARNALKGCGVAPLEISAFMEKVKYDHEVYEDKLAYLEGMQRRRGKYMIFGGKQVAPPPIVQPLAYKDGEKVLTKALNDVNPVINSVYWRKLKFVEKLMQGCPRSHLVERAILTFRWEYPFTRNPGAVLNSAISNYANNIIRDATAARRMTFSGKKSDGNFESMVVGTEFLDQMPDSDVNTMPHDLNIDINRLTSFDRRVIEEILNRDVNPTTVVDDLSRRLAVSATDIREVFGRVCQYMQMFTLAGA